MAERLLFRSGGVTVELDDIGTALAERALQRLAPKLRGAIEDAVDEVRRAAEAQWPVGRTDRNYLARHPEKRGRPHSRDLFRTEVVLQDNGRNGWEIVGRIWNGADYWRFIKALKLRGGSAIVAYVRKPLGIKRDRLRDDLPELIPEALRG